MNRGVLSRQMFRNGGAAFPDLNNDGEITQADILMGRGVEFKQEGGIAGMMPPPAAEQLDPQVVDQMLTAASQTTGDLEGAQDYEQMMNMVRGDDATMGERREELAGVVGPEDAMQTPESVLALVQPVMQIAAVDQGIGELAQQEMQQPMQGPMAGGIMENVAPPAAPAPVPMGGPPPVNFKDGGLVRRGDNQPVLKFAQAGVVPDPLAAMQDRIGNLGANLRRPTVAQGDGTRLRELFDAQRDMYREYGLGDPAARAAELEEQKKLTQAQMYFDLANTALAFAAPMQGERADMSAAERLAMAAQQTKLPQTIGARARQQLEAKKAATKEERAVDLAALQSAEKKLAAEVAAQEARELARLKKTDKAPMPMKLVVGDKTTYFNGANPTEYNKYSAMAQDQGGSIFKVGTTPKDDAPKPSMVRILVDNKETAIVDINSTEGQKAVEKARTDNPNANVQTVTISAAPAATDQKIGLYEIRNKETGEIIKSGIDIYSTDGYKTIQDLPDDQVVNKIGEYKQGSTLAAKPIEVRDSTGAIVDRLDLSLAADRAKFAELGTDVTTHTIGTYTKDSKGSVWKEIRSADGDLVNIVDTNTEAGATAVKNAASAGQGVFNIGTFSPTKEDLGTKLVVSTKPVRVGGELVATGTPLYLTDTEIAAVKTNDGAGSLRNYEKADKPPDLFGSGDAGKALKYFSVATNADGVKTIDAYAAGADDPVMESQIAIYTAAVPDARGLISRRQLPDFVKDAIKTRLLADPTRKSPVPLATLNLTTDELNTLQPTQDIPLLNTDGTVNIERATASPTFIITGLDYTRSQGFTSTLNRVFNQFAGQVAELGLGTGYAGNVGKITSAADKQLKALGRKTIDVGRAGRDGRVFALDLELLNQEVQGFYPGGGKTDVGALQQLRTVRSTLASNYARAKFIVDENNNNPGAYPVGMVGSAKVAMRDTEQLIAEYTAAILAYEANINTRPAAAASSAGGSVTSGLSRVN